MNVSKVEDNVNCLSCENLIKAEWKFCPECGMPVTSAVCSNCSALNDTNAVFCAQCGSKLKPRKQSGISRKDRGQTARRMNVWIPIWIISMFAGALFVLYIFYMEPGNAPPQRTASMEASTELSDELHQRLVLLQNRLQQNPNDYEALSALGNMFYDIANWREASRYYELALHVVPDNANMLVDYGVALYGTGQAEQGIAQLHKALTLEPEHLNAHYNLGIIFSNLHRHTEAKEWFEKFLILSPDGPQAEKARQIMAQVH